jgi:hypothetical protein
MRTSNDILGSILIAIILLIILMLCFQQYASFLYGVSVLLMSIMLLITYKIERNDQKVLPHGSVVHKNYYEIHIDKNVLKSESKLDVLIWFKLLLEKLQVAESKTILLEVSSKIINEKNIRRFFGDAAVKADEIDLLTKLVILILETASFIKHLNPFNKSKKTIRQKMKRYIIDFDKIDWNDSIAKVDNLIKKLSE